LFSIRLLADDLYSSDCNVTKKKQKKACYAICKALLTLVLKTFPFCEIDLKIRQFLVIVLLSLNQFIIGMISMHLTCIVGRDVEIVRVPKAQQRTTSWNSDNSTTCVSSTTTTVIPSL
jgi:hypothetical protein